jgi:hypothetical protein
MKARSLLVLSCSLMIFSGCISAQPTPNMTPSPPPPPMVYPEISSEIDQKIHFMDQLLEKKDLSQADREVAQNLLETYQQVRNFQASQTSRPDYQDVARQLFFSLSTLDEKYFASRQNAPEDRKKQIALFVQKKDQILNAYLSGDHEQVINLCGELKASFGAVSLTPEIGLLFALSLAQKGMLEEAIMIGEGVARKLEFSPDSLQLKASIAEWYLQRGEKEKAVEMYADLSDIEAKKATERQDLHDRIGVAEETGPESEQVSATTISPEETKPVDQLLKDLDKLLEENRFNEARELLSESRNANRSASETEMINRSLKRLELAEESYLEKKISMISIKNDMEYAQKLLEEERYEEVISRLEQMEAESADSVELRELKQFAIEKLINRDRNKAAAIFLQARKTKDPGQKKAYLVNTLEILNHLVERYPQSPMRQKLISNIKVVEGELDALGGRQETQIPQTD